MPRKLNAPRICPQEGMKSTYHLQEAPDEETKIEIHILDAQETLIREIEGTKQAGINRVAWDLRHEGPTRRSGEEDQQSRQGSRRQGPQALPGEYAVKLVIGDFTAVEKFEVALEPGLEVTMEELELQLETALRLRDLISSLNTGLRSLDNVEKQVKNLEETIKTEMDDVPEEISRSLSDMLKKIVTQRDTMVRSRSAGYAAPTQLLGKLTGWLSGVSRAEVAPTSHQLVYFKKLEAEHEEAIQGVGMIVETDVPALNQILERHQLPTVFLAKSK